MPGQRKKPESLVCSAPDPESDRKALLELRDSDSPQAKELAERLLSEEAWRSSPLGELLPGLPLIDAPNFSIRLSVRAANPLLKANLATLRALATRAPADLLALPGMGKRTAEEVCIASLIDCDEDDDPCASPLSWTPLCFIPVGSDAEDAVNNAAAGSGDSILEAVPGVSPGPWLRDKLGINGVENCSAAYKFSKGLTDWASLTRGIAGAGDWAGRHVPDIIKAGRGMARRQNERITHLPPEAEGMP